MSIFTFRVNEDHLVWLKMAAEKLGTTVSNLVRNLLLQAKDRPLLLKSLEEKVLVETAPLSQQRQELWYTIMTYFLLEFLVTHTLDKEKGDKMLSEIHERVSPQLEELNLQTINGKEGKMTLRLEKEVISWLKTSAKARGETVSQFIRNVLTAYYLEALDKGVKQPLSLAQKEGARRSILSHVLLKDYVKSAYKEGYTVTQAAYEKARPIVRRLLGKVQEEIENV